MRRVVIIKGTYGYKPEGGKHIRAKSKADGPFEVPDAEAERIVSLGIAEYVTPAWEAPVTPVATTSTNDNGGGSGFNPTGGENGSKGQNEGEAQITVEKLLEMTREEMEKLAADMGIDASKCKNKTEIAELLMSAPEYDEGADDGEEPPDPALKALVL